MNPTTVPQEDELSALNPVRVRTFFVGAAMRVWAGFCLPFAALHTLWSVPSLRRRYLTVAIMQLVATMAAAAVVFYWRDLDEDDDLSLSGILLRFYGVLVIVQSVVVALSRDFHDNLAHDVAVAAQVPPESPLHEPRVRVNATWMKKEVRHKIRGWLGVAAPFPAVWLIAGFVALCFRNLLGPLGFPDKWIDKAVGTTSSGIFAFYWVAVFTAAKCGVAWDGDERPPWFVRLWDGLTAKVPGFRWRLPKLYGRLLAKCTRFIYAPATKAESDPFLFAGLATSRIVFGVPGIYLLLRPLVPVSAAAAVVKRLPKAWPPRFPELPPRG